MEPGIYFIKDGGLKVNGGASVDGEGVTIILVGNTATVDFLGSASVRLSAPIDGPTAGLVIASGRDQPVGTSKVGGGVAMDLEGTVYLPNQHLTYGGNSTTDMPAAFTLIIAKTITFHGGSTVEVRSDYANSNVPAFITTVEAYARLVR